MKRILQHVMIFVAAVIAAGCSAGQTDGTGSGDNMGLELRNMILSSEPEPASPADRNPVAVIMDVHVGDGIASVVSSSGGDASIYLSSGGAMIGGGAHEKVRSAAVSFAAEALKHQGMMSSTAEFPYPAAGRVRFYLRTRDGVVSVDAPEAELAAGTHRLSALFRAGQEVITQFRSVNGE